MASIQASITDGYDSWYAEKIWRLLPAIYRTRDVSSAPNGVGPLREMINRIASQVAVVRRSIDRLWENESIETCDDWVIPYIGDLLATRIIAFADTRAQRLDVANTIFYRRRAGTLGLLERLAADVTDRDAHLVEFFRRLGRTRHQLDPEIGLGGVPVGKPLDPTNLTKLSFPMVEGLVGRYSLTPAGGFADLRNVYGADNAGTAFDEFAYTADLRRGAQSNGWFNISHAGVFIWWLQSFPIVACTPCAAPASCPGRFTFDPTGRQIPLFALASRTLASFGNNWVTPNEWELPVAIRQVFFKTVPDRLYPDSLSVSLGGAGVTSLIDRTDLAIFPEVGLFHFVGAQPGGPIVATFHFGFLSEIGAGGFDAGTLLPILTLPVPPQDIEQVAGGPNPPPPTLPGTVSLATALPTSPITASRTVEIVDSLTYPGPSTTQVQGIPLVVRADSPQRPTLRWPTTKPSTWTIQGGGTGSILVLQGLLLQGADVVLTGAFDAVHLRLVTLDPGTSSKSNVTPPNQQANLKTSPPPFFGIAIDGVPLRPSTLYVEAAIANLTVERCIMGPIRTRNGGTITNLTITDSIVQSIATHAPGAGPIFDPAILANELITAPSSNALVQSVIHAVPALSGELGNYSGSGAPPPQLVQDLTTAVAAQSLATRQQLEAAFPLAFADLALGTSAGTVSLSRCTVLGKTATHRMDASESILDDVALVEDTQHGCVRFTAYADGSNLHQPYRSVVVPPVGPVFVTRNFGEPEYARLRRDADNAIRAQNVGQTISSGAQNGSEMGAFSLERLPLKKRGLALKFVEFMPLGTTPVWIDAD